MDIAIPTTARERRYMGAKLMTNELTTELQFNVDFKVSRIIIQGEAQLAEMVESAVKHYSTMVFIDENIPEAKKTRTDLDEVITLLDDQRKEAKNQCDGPLRDFEEKIKEYAEEISEVNLEISESIESYEGAEKQKRSKKLQKVIAEVPKNYNVSVDEIETPSSWTNKTAFIVKGESNKKTIEEVAASMVAAASEKECIKNDRLIVENYAKTVGLDSSSWVALADKGSTASKPIEEIDSTVALKGEQEERERVKKEHDEAIAVLRTKAINNKTVDTATDETITEEAPKTCKKQQEKIATLKLTTEHQELVILNNSTINNGIQVEVIG